MEQQMAVVRGLFLLALLCLPARADAVVTVTSTADSGPGSLREAIATAAPGETIVFAPGVTGTIALVSTLTVTQPVTLQGPGAALLILDGQSMVQVFDILPGGDLTLEGVTIRGGTASSGGGIQIQDGGSLTVRRSVFVGNDATGNSGKGGAIVAQFGALATIDECTFEGNTAFEGGALGVLGTGTVTNSTFVRNEGLSRGGVAVVPLGVLTMINCTMFDNSAMSGGAIFNFGTLTVLHSTFSKNTASGNAAILRAFGSDVTFYNNIFADNSSAQPPSLFFGSGFAATSHNVFFNNTVKDFVDDASGHDTANFILAPTQPLLPLGDNGGPTQTMLPLGAARCTVDPAVLPPDLMRDQRGFPRVTGSCLDAGAVQASAAGMVAPAPALSLGSFAVALAVLAGIGGIGLLRR